MPITINIPTLVSQTITNGVTAYAPSEDVVFDALAGKTSFLSNTTQFTISSPNDQVAHVFNITGMFSVGNILSIGGVWTHNSSNQNKTVKVWLNSTGDLSGSPVEIHSMTINTATGALARGWRRDFVFDADTTLRDVARQTTFSVMSIFGNTVQTSYTGNEAVTVPSISGNLYCIITGATNGTLIIQYNSLFKL